MPKTWSLNVLLAMEVDRMQLREGKRRFACCSYKFCSNLPLWILFNVTALQEAFCVTEPERCAFVFQCLTCSSFKAEQHHPLAVTARETRATEGCGASARGKQPLALPSLRSVVKMPVAIWSESGAADPAPRPCWLCCQGVWGTVQPPPHLRERSRFLELE